MADYTRKELSERWEKAKENMSDPDTMESIALHVLPAIWEVSIFPRWIFRNFLDKKIIESAASAIMSRNVSYDQNSDDTQEWGWFRWTYRFDTQEICYVFELDYDVKPEDIKALFLVSGILDICLLESPTSIIGKFKWRSPLLQRIPLIRRIPFINTHRFLFYFEMTKRVQMKATSRPIARRNKASHLSVLAVRKRSQGKARDMTAQTRYARQPLILWDEGKILRSPEAGAMPAAAPKKEG